MRTIFSHTLLASLCLILWACGGGGAAEEQAAEEQKSPTLTPSQRVMYLEDKGLASPESIIKHGDIYYIANVGKELLPSEKDGDGFISKMDSEGNAIERNFAEGLDAPKGMAILNGTLYVADVDKVKGFDLATGNAAGEIDFSFSGTAFLNDIAAKSGNEIFVSATDINKVYQVTLPDGKPEEIVTTPTIQKPNGLAYDAGSNQLYVSTFAPEAAGVVGVITMKPKVNTFTTLSGDYKGSLDGIGMLGDLLYFTDWNRGSLLLLDINANRVAGYPVKLPTESGQIKGPADAFLDVEKGEFWIPGMQENTVTILSLPF